MSGSQFEVASCSMTSLQLVLAVLWGMGEMRYLGL